MCCASNLVVLSNSMVWWCMPAGDDAEDMGQGGPAVPQSQMRLMPPSHATQVAPVQRAAPGVRALDKFRQLGNLTMPFARQVASLSSP